MSDSWREVDVAACGGATGLQNGQRGRSAQCCCRQLALLIHSPKNVLVGWELEPEPPDVVRDELFLNQRTRRVSAYAHATWRGSGENARGGEPVSVQRVLFGRAGGGLQVLPDLVKQEYPSTVHVCENVGMQERDTFA
jgi:hypothetical protein